MAGPESDNHRASTNGNGDSGVPLKRRRRVAVIGAGPSGAITIDALVREACFDVVRVFERREAPGGCWVDDAGLYRGVSTPASSGGGEAVLAHGTDGAKPGSEASGTTPPPPHLEPDMLAALAAQTADPPVEIPRDELLACNDGRLREDAARLRQQREHQPRFAESSIYPYLETNVDVVTMQYSQEPIRGTPTARSVALHGEDTPFRHWTEMRSYVEKLVRRRGYEELIEYSTTVERAEKVGEEWKLTLRKEVVRKAGGDDGIADTIEDEWWVEWFDGLVVASGHFNVPYIPHVQGLADLVRDRPGSVLHSKQFRGRDAFKGKRVIVVGASVSAADITFDLVQTAELPVHAVMVGRNPNPFFGDVAFYHPGIARHPTILRIDVESSVPDSSSSSVEARLEDTTSPQRRRTVHFIDGTSVSDVDHIIFGTGYTWSLPFLFPSSSLSSGTMTTNEASSRKPIEVRNNRVPNLYQHVVYTPDPSLCFVGGVGAGLTFKIFEWQAVLAASVMAGRAALPVLEEQQRWEQERIKARGDGKGFLTIAPDFEEYFETLRHMADGDHGATINKTDTNQEEKNERGGTPHDKLGRRVLPPFDKVWQDAFMAGHERRKDMWARIIARDTASWDHGNGVQV